MSETHTLETLQPEHWALYRELRLSSLLDSPDAFGSTHALEASRALELWQSRLAAAAASGSDLPLLARVVERPAGLCWAKKDGVDASVVNVFQMWVVPAYRRMGIGQSLLQRSIEWARSVGATEVRLGAALADSPAYRLYTRNGFTPQGRPQPLREGVDILGQNMSLNLAMGGRGDW